MDHELKTQSGELAVEYRQIQSLTPYPQNPRTHTAEQIRQIARSIREFGFTNPLLVDLSGRLIAGHGRLEAAKQLRMETVPVIVLEHLTAEQRRAYLIADNQLATQAGWNQDLLRAELEALEAEKIDLQNLGFSEQELNELLERTDPGDGEGDGGEEDAEPIEPPAEPLTRTGDLWTLGRHRLLCGDSFKQDRRALLCPKPPDMVLTDPPFAIYGSATGISSSIADDKMVRPFFEHLCRSIVSTVPKFAHVYIHCDWRSWPALWEGARISDLTVKNCIVWDKMSSGLGNMYAQTHEFIGFFVPEPPQKAMTSGRKSGHRTVLHPNLVRYGRTRGAEREHNASKPVDLLADLIRNSSDEGGVVLDLFGGSGSTLIAAEKVGRACWTMEIEPRWCDVIVQRWLRLGGDSSRVALWEGEEVRQLEEVQAERRGAEDA